MTPQWTFLISSLLHHFSPTLCRKEDPILIQVASGVGSGPTKISAFDSALDQAGIANFNLIQLSSVIPPNTSIECNAGPIPPKAVMGAWGDRLFVVMAEHRVDVPNTDAWAGIGWMQEPKSGKGLFVEHEGNSERFVQEAISSSLDALAATRGIDFGIKRMVVKGITCRDRPVCALVVATFMTMSWNDAVVPNSSNG